MVDLPVVTVGIPTYLRPELLRRCLESVARQDYSAINVVISDNATPGDAVVQVVASFRDRIPRLRLTRQGQNVGARANLRSILDDAQTEYFMWLGDDDEISPNYVSGLVALLESDKSAVSAVGRWQLKLGEDHSQIMPTTAFPQASRGKRVFRFVWKSNDYFFYGLHRTAALKRATFRPYWRPNREQIQNWAYLYLLDLVIDGKVLLSDDPSVRWINHAYTPKTWPIQQGRFATLGRGFIRRINLHWFMIEKIARRAGFDVALGVLPIAATRLGIEAIQSSGALASSAARKIARRVRQRSATGTPT